MTDTDFYPTDTLACPAEIRRSAVRLEAITGVLLGHGDNVGYVLSQLALSFSEVIAPAVSAQIGSNTAALEAAVEGTQYGHAVGLQWADDVEEFKAARAALIAHWEAAEFDDFGVPPVAIARRAEADRVEQQSERRVQVADARSAALASFVAEGQVLWEAFQDKVMEKGRMFREGPTAANLALLVSSLGWGAMTLWPEMAPPPVSAADGVTDGGVVIDGLDGAAGPQAVVDALADVAAITRRAEAGQELTLAELDYLETFYATMGVRVTEVPDYLAQTSFEYTTSSPYPGTPWPDEDAPPLVTTHVLGELDPALVTTLTASAANGLLVLSRPTARTDDAKHDGYERLPEWVRDAVDGDETYSGPPSPATSGPIIGVGSDFEMAVGLAGLLDYSTVEGGSGFSHRLAIAAQNMTHIGADAGYYFPDPETADDVLQEADATGRTFLDVVARNDEASYDLLFGEDMPDDYDPEEFFADIYRFQWSDDGQSAAQLTNFIFDWESSETPGLTDRADMAMARLVDITTSDDFFATLMDDVGTSSDDDVSALGQVNPAITAHFGELMVTYFDEFSGLNPDSPLSGVGTLDTVRFATLVSTDDASATALVAHVDAYERELLRAIPDAVGVNELGGPIGRMHGIVDSGLMNASMDMFSDQEQASERAYQVRQFAFGLVGAASGALPPPFSILVDAIAGSIAASDGPADVVTPDDLDPENYESETMIQRQYDTAGASLQSMIDAGLVDDAGLASLREQGLVVGNTVAEPSATGESVEYQTDLLVAAADAAASAAGLDLPSVQLLIEHIESAYGEVIAVYRAEDPAEYEERIAG